MQQPLLFPTSTLNYRGALSFDRAGSRKWRDSVSFGLGSVGNVRVMSAGPLQLIRGS